MSGPDGVRVVLTKLWNGESPIDHAREKGMIIRCGDGLVGCGLDKVRVFQQCVVPPLKEFYATQTPDTSSAINNQSNVQ